MWLKVESSPSYLVATLPQIILYELEVEINFLTLDFVLDPCEITRNSNSSVSEPESICRLSVPFASIKPPCITNLVLLRDLRKAKPNGMNVIRIV